MTTAPFNARCGRVHFAREVADPLRSVHPSLLDWRADVREICREAQIYLARFT